MQRKPSELYTFHVANLNEIDHSIRAVERFARNEIGLGNPENSLQSLLRLYAFLIGAWAETRLNKLLHEEFGFSKKDRTLITAQKTQLDQWIYTVDIAFRKHHNVEKAELNDRTIGASHAEKRNALHDVLLNELRIIIEIRNKLAHGQWVFPLNSKGTAVVLDKCELINKENLQSLQQKLNLLKHLASVMHDLVVSQTTFERDFEKHFQGVSQARINLKTKDYDKYKAQLVQRKKAASTKRNGS